MDSKGQWWIARGSGDSKGQVWIVVESGKNYLKMVFDDGGLYSPAILLASYLLFVSQNT